MNFVCLVRFQQHAAVYYCINDAVHFLVNCRDCRLIGGTFVFFFSSLPLVSSLSLSPLCSFLPVFPSSPLFLNLNISRNCILFSIISNAFCSHPITTRLVLFFAFCIYLHAPPPTTPFDIGHCF